MEAVAIAWGMLIGLVIGFTLAVTVGIGALVCFRLRTKLRTGTHMSASQRIAAASAAESDSNLGQDSPRSSEWSNLPMWLEALKKNTVVSACGIPKYSYGYVYCMYILYCIRIAEYVLLIGAGFGRDIKKATCDFTTAIGQGAFGPVYKAQMTTGDTFAVKVLAANSSQGQHEFLAEVIIIDLLGL